MARPSASTTRSSHILPLLLAVVSTVTSGCLVDDDLFQERQDALTDSDGDGYSPDQGDCNDADPAVFPGATELCNGIDDDCSGQADDGAQGPTWYFDQDLDGYGDPDSSVVSCEQPAGFVDRADDCDDGDSTIHPGATELCDGVDQDCDDEVDEGAAGTQTWYADADGDDFGDSSALSVEACAPPGTAWTTVPGDCDDGNAAIYPGADEYCNGIDDNCDDVVDDAPTVDPPTWYLDDDSDGWGSDDAVLVQCAEPAGYVARGGDCDDRLASRHPDADETCNGIDDDCDDLVDEAPTVGDGTWYHDADGDGFGAEDDTLVTCEPPDDYVAYPGDCDDGDDAVHPDAEEVCNDGIDNDCDATETDPGIGDECHWDEALELIEQVVLVGTYEDDSFGRGVAYGDLDGDGVTELLIGAPYGYDADSDTHPGILFSFEAPITEGGTRDDADWALHGPEDASQFSHKLAVGDIDGDGVDDLIVGAWSVDAGEIYDAGLSYIQYGPITAGGAIADTADWVLSGVAEEEKFGRIVRMVGDLDNDGVDDVIVGSHEVYVDTYKGAGLLYLLTDAGSGSGDVDDVATAMFTPDQDETVGPDFTGIDIDGDGVDDLLLGAYSSDRSGISNAGGAYIFYGGALTGEINTDDYDLFWAGESSGAQAGRSVDNIGDVNGDGTDDIIIGQYHHGDGSAMIQWGGSSATSGSLADADVTFRGTIGATSDNVRYLGYMTRRLDDVNGDGAPDVLIGEAGDEPNDHYVFYGPFDETAVIYDTDADVVLYAPEHDSDTDQGLAPGDITGDGVSDIVLGNYTHTAGFDLWAGAVYIVPGMGL